MDEAAVAQHQQCQTTTAPLELEGEVLVTVSRRLGHFNPGVLHKLQPSDPGAYSDWHRLVTHAKPDFHITLHEVRWYARLLVLGSLHSRSAAGSDQLVIKMLQELASDTLLGPCRSTWICSIKPCKGPFPGVSAGRKYGNDQQNPLELNKDTGVAGTVFPPEYARDLGHNSCLACTEVVFQTADALAISGKIVNVHKPLLSRWYIVVVKHGRSFRLVNTVKMERKRLFAFTCDEWCVHDEVSARAHGREPVCLEAGLPPVCPTPVVGPDLGPDVPAETQENIDDDEMLEMLEMEKRAMLGETIPLQQQRKSEYLNKVDVHLFIHEAPPRIVVVSLDYGFLNAEVTISPNCARCDVESCVSDLRQKFLHGVNLGLSTRNSESHVMTPQGVQRGNSVRKFAVKSRTCGQQLGSESLVAAG
eukprot:6035577-Amphidinium_carterae.3